MKYQAIIERMTLEDKVALCSGADMVETKAFPQYGIPSIVMIDGPHGLRKELKQDALPGAQRAIPATCFPTACATASSWDRSLLREMGEAMAEEALQEGVSIILGPGVNIKRNPLCGRNFEYLSEDPFLAGELATSMIQGIQSKGVGASLKHLAANSQEHFRFSSDSIIDERTLRELYLPAFEKVVKAAKPATVMCAYNLLNGIYCSDHVTLLRHILRDEWGFEGVVVSDWSAVNDRVEALKAGLDLEMPYSEGFFDQALIKAIQSGKLSEALLDESVDRLLELIFTAHQNKKADYHYNVQAHHELAQTIAASSAVLLKNEDHLLPIPRTKRIALIGAMAQEPRFQGAGSSFVTPTRLGNAIAGFDTQQLQYAYFPGYDLKGPGSEWLVQEAVAGAQAHDVAVIMAGLPADYEGEGFDRANMQLPPSHNDLISRVAAVNPNTIVVLAGGAPIEMPWLPQVKAVLHMHLAGQAGGLAVADLLTGVANPSGKLAESYPLCYEDVPSAGFYEQGGKQAQYREGIYVGYRYYDKAGKSVAFPFGHGLSYTTFDYSHLWLSRTEMLDGDELVVSVNVKNTGAMDGAEVVQVYVSDLTQAIFRPEKELKEFAKVFLKPGEEKRLSFRLGFRSFACYDATAKAWVVPDGDYAISIAASSRDIRLRESVRVHGTVMNAHSAEPPAWYRRPAGTVSQQDFQLVLGRAIPSVRIPQKGQYDLSCSMREMDKSLVMRILRWYTVKTIAKDFGGVDYTNPNFKSLMEVTEANPLKSLVMSSSGRLPLRLAQALLAMANGHVWEGLKMMVRRTRKG